MNLKSNVVRIVVLGALLASAALGTGCGGLGASGSVSPATFLVPGLMLNEPVKPAQPDIEPHETSPVVAANSSDLT